MMSTTITHSKNVYKWRSDPAVVAWLNNCRLFNEKWISKGYKTEYNQSIALVNYLISWGVSNSKIERFYLWMASMNVKWGLQRGFCDWKGKN